MARDPNQGSSLGWVLIALLVVGGVAAVFFIGPLCPQPESWKDYKRSLDQPLEQPEDAKH